MALSPPVELTTTDGTCRVVLSGEIDVANAHQISDLACAVIKECDGDALVIDLSAVTFIDSSGLGALVRIRNAAVACGLHTTATGANAQVTQVLSLTALDTAFGMA